MEVVVDYSPKFKSRYGYDLAPTQYMKNILEAKKQEQYGCWRWLPMVP